MLPEFPKFKGIELTDKEDVEKITRQYPPYSDFNFVSMWSWDIKGEMLISQLYGNLVVRFTDYLTGEPFYSFLGNNKASETTKALLELSKDEGLKPLLRFVPEDSIKNIDNKRFKIEEDRDHFDYVFSHKNIALYEGSEYKRQRNKVRRFENNHKHEILTLNLTDKNNQKLILDLVESWVNSKNGGDDSDEDYLAAEDLENELIAFKKVMAAPTEFLSSLICFSLFIDGVLTGFMINEKISKDYSLAHFGKADVKYNGIYQFLMKQNSKVFLDLGINYMNHEQDLGVEKLRYAKMRFRPALFLKKYLVRYL